MPINYPPCLCSILSFASSFLQVLNQLGLEGVLVLEVPHGSLASLAGLRPTHRDIFGDVVLGDVVVGSVGIGECHGCSARAFSDRSCHGFSTDIILTR